MCAAKNGKPGENYNLASGVETTIKQLAETINEITGNLAPMVVQPARPWDRSGCRFGSTEKSKSEIGFEAQVSLREGLEKTVAWTQANKTTIGRCMNQHDYFIERLDQGGPC
jgi:nucleoside-diphosphate-sugar epimerase